MKKNINKEFQKLAKVLGYLRRFTKFATLQEVALINNVTPETVFNFEDGKIHDLNLLLYYYFNISCYLSTLSYVGDNMYEQFEKVIDIEIDDYRSSH